MSESTMRRRVVAALRDLHAVAVENLVGAGTPDVNYVGGWIELKQVKSWPKDIDRPLRVPHFTKEQRLWLKERREMGGNAWVLLQVKSEWLLIDGGFAADFLGGLTRASLCETAATLWKHWPDGLNGVELYLFLR